MLVFTISDETQFAQILTQAYKRMHRYTCAEASLQALLTLWDLPQNHAWATSGYLGAITSGNMTCGLLIGSSIAIGLRCGQGVPGIPEEHDAERGKAIQAVNELYTAFLKKFKSTDCKTLNKVDFTVPEELAKWMMSKGWKQTCDVFLGFTLRKCVQIVEKGTL